MIRVNDQYVWNVIFSILFLALVATATVLLERGYHLTYAELQAFDYLIIVLATWRLVRLFSKDNITRFFREQFWDEIKVGDTYVLQKPPAGPRRTIADLMSCPWCFGPWVAMIVIFFYLFTPYAFFPTLVLAVSAVASFMQLVSTLIGNLADKFGS